MFVGCKKKGVHLLKKYIIKLIQPTNSIRTFLERSCQSYCCLFTIVLQSSLQAQETPLDLTLVCTQSNGKQTGSSDILPLPRWASTSKINNPAEIDLFVSDDLQNNLPQHALCRLDLSTQTDNQPSTSISHLS